VTKFFYKFTSSVINIGYYFNYIPPFLIGVNLDNAILSSGQAAAVMICQQVSIVTMVIVSPYFQVLLTKPDMEISLKTTSSRYPVIHLNVN
jgi:hypothetical protein